MDAEKELDNMLEAMRKDLRDDYLKVAVARLRLLNMPELAINVLLLRLFQNEVDHFEREIERLKYAI